MLYNNAKIGNAGILKKRFGISSHNSNEIYLSNSYRPFTTEYYFLNVNLYALHFPQFDKIQKYYITTTMMTNVLNVLRRSINLRKSYT